MFNKRKDKLRNAENVDETSNSQDSVLSKKINDLNNGLLEIRSEMDSVNKKLNPQENNEELLIKVEELNNNVNNLSEDVLSINNDINNLSTIVSNIEKSNEELSHNISSLKKNYDDILDSYNAYFKTLFIDNDPIPSEFIRNLRNLSLELLTFFNNVCKKYNLEYWLDFGTLLGAVRHKGFIPWDDDLDIGMMRKDFEILKDVLIKEVAHFGLDDVIRVNTVRTPRRTSTIAFIQMFYKPEGFDKTLASLDVFPYDFVENIGPDMVHYFKEEKLDFHVKLGRGLNDKLGVEELMDKMELNYHKTDYIIPSVDNLRGFHDTYKFAVFKTDIIFPLGLIEYNGKRYPCPNNYDYYLQNIYGDYWEMPKLIRQHDYILDYLRRYPDINNHYENHISRLKEINKNFS